MEMIPFARRLRIPLWLVCVVLAIAYLISSWGSSSISVSSVLRTGLASVLSAGGAVEEEVAAHPARELTDETFAGAGQEDPALVAYIRRRLLLPPSTQPYNLSRPRAEHFSQYGQTKYANDRILRNMSGGFFVEVGAVDGEHLSNTLFLERRLGWTGLLIEANPATYRQLLHKHRKAHSINAALSHTNFSTQINFRTSGKQGVLGHIDEDFASGIKVKALPFWSILQALNVSVIDFLSMDIERSEVKVLRTIPWDKVRVRLMCVECQSLLEGRAALVKHLTSRGYFYIGKRGIDCWFGLPELLLQTLKGIW